MKISKYKKYMVKRNCNSYLPIRKHLKLLHLDAQLHTKVYFNNINVNISGICITLLQYCN